jgi:hypothetical protein
MKEGKKERRISRREGRKEGRKEERRRWTPHAADEGVDTCLSSRRLQETLWGHQGRNNGTMEGWEDGRKEGRKA